MSLFRHYPIVNYNFNGEVIPVVNLVRSFRVRPELLVNEDAFVIYDIRDDDTPEIIADKAYDDPSLAWLVLYVNGIMDIYTQWPKNQTSLERYIIDKYGTSGRNNIRHYVNGKGQVVSENWPIYDRSSVTNLEYEVEQNDLKRKIRVLLPEYIDQLKQELRDVFS